MIKRIKKYIKKRSMLKKFGMWMERWAMLDCEFKHGFIPYDRYDYERNNIIDEISELRLKLKNLLMD